MFFERLKVGTFQYHVVQRDELSARIALYWFLRSGEEEGVCEGLLLWINPISLGKMGRS